MLKKYLGILCAMFCVCNIGISKTWSWSNPSVQLLQTLADSVGNGDTILISSQTTEEAAVWNKSNLLIRGTKNPLFKGGITLDNKAIWEFTGSNITIENIAFGGLIDNSPTGDDSNAAGIYFSGTNLTLRNCWINGCCNGLITTKNLNSTVTIINSRFEYNGFDNKVTQNVGIGECQQFTMTGCYVRGANGVPHVQSAADNNYLAYNRILDEDTIGRAPLLNFPSGGRTVLTGNVFQRSSMTEQKAGNKIFVQYGYTAAPAPLPSQTLILCNNTFVDEFSNGGIYVIYPTGYVPDSLLVVNNFFVGPGSAHLYSTGGTKMSHLDSATNTFVNSFTVAAFKDYTTWDYHLTAASPAVNAGSTTNLPFEASLLPTQQPVAPDSSAPRVTVEKMDAGAYEFPTPLAVQETPVAMPTASLVLYPNPATTHATVSLPAGDGISSVELFNQVGVKISHVVGSRRSGDEASIDIDTRELPAGIYFVKMHAGMTTMVKTLQVLK